MKDVTIITIAKRGMTYKTQFNSILTKEQINTLCAKYDVTYLHSKVVRKATIND